MWVAAFVGEYHAYWPVVQLVFLGVNGVVESVRLVCMWAIKIKDLCCT